MERGKELFTRGQPCPRQLCHPALVCRSQVTSVGSTTSTSVCETIQLSLASGISRAPAVAVFSPPWQGKALLQCRLLCLYAPEGI